MKSIQITYNDISVDITLNNNITLLKDYSGSGKTFLFTILIAYFQENNIPFSHFDYKSMDSTLDEFNISINNKEFVLMDCADLYMTKELWSLIKNTNCYFIISLKNIAVVEVSDVDICFLRYENDSIYMEPLS